MDNATHAFPVPEPSPGQCAWCGNVARSEKTGRLVKYCSQQCRDRSKWHRRYWRNKGEEPQPANRRCANCGELLHFQRGVKKYCSKPECHTAARHERLSKNKRCDVHGCERGAYSKGLCSSHYSDLWKSLNPERWRVNRQKQDHRRRALKSGAFVEDVDRLVVLERDGWKCHLCGEQIPRDVEWPDLMYPTIDHVVPLAEGGEHSYANVAAAHWSCNAAKSNRGGGEQLALM